MARRQNPPTPESRKLNAEELGRAISKLKKRIEELKAFDVSHIVERSDAGEEALRLKHNATITEIFGEGTAEATQYSIWDFNRLPLVMGESYHPAEHQRAVRDGLDRQAIKLQSLVDLLEERLEELAETVTVQQASTKKPAAPGRKIFVVHGHDKLALLEVVAFLKQLDFDPIVLGDLPNSGRTIIEKLEHHTGVDFAIVILTPDDEGRAVGADGGQATFQPRARQNVVLELGLFYGMLGRGKVCALHKGNLELPSDFHGVLYTPFDADGGWHFKLAKELRAAGLTVDMNKLG